MYQIIGSVLRPESPTTLSRGVKNSELSIDLIINFVVNLTDLYTGILPPDFAICRFR